MNKADSNLLNQLFKENNDLRAQINVLNRDIFNRTVQNENAEDEIQQLQAKIELLTNENKKASAKTESRKETPSAIDDLFNANFISDDKLNLLDNNNNNKFLKETQLLIEEKDNEISKLKDDLSQARTYIEQQNVINNKLENEIQEKQDQLNEYKSKEDDNDYNDIS
ncbi:hypothetical protein PIROE2DRAFT_6058, partial [Piromyces sp. E2]